MSFNHIMEATFRDVTNLFEVKFTLMEHRIRNIESYMEESIKALSKISKWCDKWDKEFKPILDDTDVKPLTRKEFKEMEKKFYED